MRLNIIQKTIDLSHYKSNYPSMIPYFDENGNLVTSTSDKPNQGYCVSDIIIPSSFPYEDENGNTIPVNLINNIQVQTDVNILLPKGDGEFEETIPEDKKYASFQTLVIWYRFFRKYYDALYTTRCDGDIYQFQTTDPEYAITPEMQDLFNRLGGEVTYQWLKEILEPRYEVSTDSGINFQYFYTSLTWWDIQYHLKLIQSTSAKANELDELAACCLLEKLHAQYGGEENFDKIYKWLKEQKAPFFDESKGKPTEMGSINIPLTISCDFDLIGEKMSIYEDWLPGEEYGEGTYIRYGDDVYIKQNGDSFLYDDCQKELTWESGSWKNSYEQYIEDESPKDIVLSGQTESKLSEFVDVKRCYDVLGNDMHGKFLEDKTSSGPKEDGVQLDLQYHIYNVCNLEKLDIPYIFEDTKYYKVFGNILTNIKIYLQSSLGEIIEEYEFEWNQDSANVAKIEELLEKANDSADTENLCDGNLYAEFKYVMGTTLMLIGSKDECHYDIDEESKEDGVFYTDRKIITKKSEVYQASTTSSYLIYYFDVQAAEQKTVKNTVLNSVEIYDMADYQTTVKYDSSIKENAPLIYAPLAFEDFRFGTTSLQHVDSDVFVQRGTSAALEKYIAMGSIQTFEALENYQNSNINIINSNQE